MIQLLRGQMHPNRCVISSAGDFGILLRGSLLQAASDRAELSKDCVWYSYT